MWQPSCTKCLKPAVNHVLKPRPNQSQWGSQAWEGTGFWLGSVCMSVWQEGSSRMVVLSLLFTCRGESSMFRHCTETSARRTPVCLTITCLQDFTAPLIELTCFMCSKFKFSTTDENKWQNSSHSTGLNSCIKTSRAFKYYPPDNYKEPHQWG